MPKEQEPTKEELDAKLDRLLEEDYIDQGNPNTGPVKKNPVKPKEKYPRPTPMPLFDAVGKSKKPASKKR